MLRGGVGRIDERTPTVGESLDGYAGESCKAALARRYLRDGDQAPSLPHNIPNAVSSVPPDTIF